MSEASIQSSLARQGREAGNPFLDEAHVACKAEDAPRQMESDLNSLRVKVAEFCGWTNLKKFSHVNGDRITGLRGVGPGWMGSYRGTVPDWPLDLNACADFERDVLMKDVSLYLGYAVKLETECGGGSIDAHFATAEQRCRAFVAVMEAPSVGRGGKQGAAPVNPKEDLG